jgi:hypothetical protein
MMANRQAAEGVILEYMEKLLPGGPMHQIYTELFATMDDPAFDSFMKSLQDGSARLAVITPNLGRSATAEQKKVRLKMETNFAIAKELGHDFFQRIWMDPGNGVPRYLTNKKYMVVELPLRRQAQLLEKKIGIPKDNKSIDELTGQPSGASKGSKISYPETQIMAALDLPASQEEMLKYRGGDVKGFDAMNTMIDRNGSVSMKSIEHLGTKVESTKTLSIFLSCMHLSNTL